MKIWKIKSWYVQIRPVTVRRVDKSVGLAEANRRFLHADEVFTREIPFRLPAIIRRANMDALDKYHPSWAALQDTITKSFGS